MGSVVSALGCVPETRSRRPACADRSVYTRMALAFALSDDDSEAEHARDPATDAYDESEWREMRAIHCH